MIPDLSVVWVIFFVLLLAIILGRVLFRPIQQVMEARDQAIGSARALATSSAVQARAAAAEFEAKTFAARADVYRQMDEKRRAALEWRGNLLISTRRDVEASIAEATNHLKAQADEARQRLALEAGSLATAIVERVLGRKAS